MTDFPYRCVKCDKTFYRKKMNAKIDCCDGAQVNPLAIICHLIPCPTSEKPLHVSRPKEGLVDHSKEWVIGCGKKELPPHRTDMLLAVTCKGCLEAADRNLKNSGTSLEEYQSNLAEVLGEATESNESVENETIDSDTEIVVKFEESETPDSP